MKYRFVLLLRFFLKLNWWKTILINFRLLPFKKAIIFPVLIFGKCKLHHLKGAIVFNCPIQFGQLLIGLSDAVRSYDKSSYISLLGTLEVGKHVVLRRGIRLSVSGSLQLGDNVFISDNNTIICVDNVVIKNSTRFANNVTLMDTDFHYILNTITREVKQNHAPIEIGENNWIGSWTTIKKGAKTPKGTIIAGPFSTIGKDFIGRIPENSFLAGSPVKLIREGFRRVNSKESDALIRKHFCESALPFVLSDDVDIDSFCMPQRTNGISAELL